MVHFSALQPHSVDQVFNVAELVVAMLSFLPPIDMLRATGTCHGFYSAVHTNPENRMALFLQAAPANPHSTVYIVDHDNHTLTKTTASQINGQPFVSELNFNPMLFDMWNEREFQEPTVRAYRPYVKLEGCLPPNGDATKQTCPRMFLKMFVSQPPVTRVYLETLAFEEYPTWVKIERPQGVTFSDLVLNLGPSYPEDDGSESFGFQVKIRGRFTLTQEERAELKEAGTVDYTLGWEAPPTPPYIGWDGDSEGQDSDW